jgi:bacillithiol biosynthesis cysteine-adding enzyme BshC
MSENAISFRDIPKTTKLFQDFLYDFDRVAEFYDADGQNNATLSDRARRIAKEPYPRTEIAEALKAQNASAGAGEATFANIERLRQEDSVVVITGQQAGLFSGPLFTLYKALTVLKLTEQLRGEGVNAVPMFWIASEDHDLAEVNHCRVVNRDGQLVTIKYDSCDPADGKPVGEIHLCEEINDSIAELIGALPVSEFVDQLKIDLEESYKPGVGFAEAFGKLMMRFFSRFGVILIDPLDGRLKEIAGTIYSRAINATSAFADALVGASQKLEAAGYHAQVFASPDSVPLFLLDEGRRTALQRGSDGFFHLKGAQKKFAAAELIDSVEKCPSCFSPNVTLRPIVQDFLLPTVAYIGGPAEIAYFAQVRPAYRLLGRLEPVILPRASLTLIEKRQVKTLQKNGLEFADLFSGPQETTAKAIEHGLQGTTGEAFEETERLFQEQLEKLRAMLQKVDPTLGDAIKGSREKILYQLGHLKNRFIHNRSQRDATTVQQIERLFAILYPNKALQEREINASYFLARYGYELIDLLYAEIDPWSHEHKLLYLG